MREEAISYTIRAILGYMKYYLKKLSVTGYFIDLRVCVWQGYYSGCNIDHNANAGGIIVIMT